MKTIPTEVLTVLAASTMENDRLTLPQQLPRDIYVKTDKVLKDHGVLWDRKLKCHVAKRGGFDTLRQAIQSGKSESQQQKHQAFYTPKELAERMALLAVMGKYPGKGFKALEPSAGEGALADALTMYLTKEMIVCVELEDRAANLLRDKGYYTVNVDFLLCQHYQEFDLIIMNPPFARRQDANHILHAWHCLKPGGRLVAICGAGLGFRTEPIYEDLRELVQEVDGSVEDLPEGTFRESGTDVRAMLLVLDKPEAK